MTREEELQKILDGARIELNSIEEVRRFVANSALVGKYYKFYNNYFKIKSIDDYGNLMGIEFEIGKNGQIHIQENSVYSLDGLIEISGSEFDKAWKALKKRINTMNK